MTTLRRPHTLTILLACITMAPLLSAAAIAAPAYSGAPNEADDYGYGFYRTVEGKALLTGLEQDAEPLELEPNYPVLTGDRIWLEDRARIEALLPDRVVLRLEQNTEVFFESLAGSADGPEDADTVLRLFEGEIQVVGDDRVLSDEPLTIVTSNSHIYLHLPGTYRLISDGRGWTEVAVREGFAEINTERGSVVARTGESALVDGDLGGDVSVADAGPMNDLEYWGAELSGQQLARTGEYVDDSLSYAAAPLEDSGEWVNTAGRAAWRPTVRVGWRPFSDGWWVYTPSGLSWVAYERWGWVTSHYGAWDYVPGYGWLWFPGSTYSPAWVYWYWGPTHSAWVPSGYYTRYYGSRFDAGFRFGVYGWAGGSWDRWSHWTFCPTRYFGRRNYRSYWRSGHDMHRDRRLHAVPRGIITTDTRDLNPQRWGKPTEIVGALEQRHRKGAPSTRSLGDVTSFVERRADLPDNVRQIVSNDRRMSVKGGPTTLSRDRADRALPQKATPQTRGENPWRVERPDTARRVDSRDRVPSERTRLGEPKGTDWEVIERLRRFENKQEGLPASPRSGVTDGSSPESRYIVPRSPSPTRRILEGVRAREPVSAPQNAAPTASPQRPTSRQPVRSTPSTSSSSRRPTTSKASPARPSSSSNRSSGSVSSRKPSSKPSSAKPRSGSTSRSSARKKKG